MILGYMSKFSIHIMPTFNHIQSHSTKCIYTTRSNIHMGGFFSVHNQVYVKDPYKVGENKPWEFC